MVINAFLDDEPEGLSLTADECLNWGDLKIPIDLQSNPTALSVAAFLVLRKTFGAVLTSGAGRRRTSLARAEASTAAGNSWTPACRSRRRITKGGGRLSTRRRWTVLTCLIFFSSDVWCGCYRGRSRM